MNMMVTRRALLGGMALGGAAAFLPGPALAFRADGATLYPANNAFIKGFVDRRELAGALACIGKGQAVPVTFGAGTQEMDSAKPGGPDRTRVAEGKSVSVRVDIGGSRITKTTQTH